MEWHILQYTKTMGGVIREAPLVALPATASV